MDDLGLAHSVVERVRASKRDKVQGGRSERKSLSLLVIRSLSDETLRTLLGTSSHGD